MLCPDGEAVVLIKPQFEAGKEQVGARLSIGLGLRQRACRLAVCRLV